MACAAMLAPLLLLLTACGSVPVTSLWKLRKLNLETLDPAALRAAVVRAPGLQLHGHSLELTVAVSRKLRTAGGATTTETLEDELALRHQSEQRRARAEGLAEPSETQISERMLVNIGPSHPLSHGTLRVLVELEGETIKHAIPEIGYLHRGFEKSAEKGVWNNVIPYADRLNYVSALSNNVAYVKAVEKLAAIPGPAYLRLGISAFTTDCAVLAENPETLTRQYARRDPAAAGLTVVGAGQGVQLALNALKNLGLEKLNVDVFGLARYPWDFAADSGLRASVEQTRRVLFVEEHYGSGGMGESFVAALPGARQTSPAGARAMSLIPDLPAHVAQEQ